ncbi:MAG: hypothetical protein J7K72_01500 [Candidatus Aenigmarchaeota archaeon]|nr:hypothetical protein [Candidatus Aenigmarchaeota archaeon]
MRLAMEVVLIAVVLLVVAAVVLSIFSGGMGSFGGVSSARNQCWNMAKYSCEAGGSAPPGWDTNVVFKTGDKTYTCKDLTGKDKDSLSSCCQPIKQGDIVIGYQFACK